MAKKQQARRKQKFQPGFGWVKPLPALFSVAGSVLSLALMLNWIQDPHQWPVNNVRIEGTFHYLQQAEVQQVVAPLAAAGFFVMDVADIQARLQSLAWVKQVSVRRVWPDQLSIRVREQQAVAHWGADGFINAQAEVFKPGPVIGLVGLPRLSGPQGYQQRVLTMYRKMQTRLQPLQLTVAALTLDARRAWQLQLSNGLSLAAGRNGALQRLARFIGVYPAILAAGKGRLTAVDLRYSNGFAAHWQAVETRSGHSG